ncbi:hypothetical protein I6E52_04105 [Salinibacterium sp. NG253]|uniref:hypothetical protein n=1 Tax=Salinibacterium sp. NG253 TaxID=2792039 RepID=UPI0018CCA709|nr:hypothetical protein [Salinibacterium sp. NG253]MBH0116023.1 hypothetical protein [Salinibacterium sp. NG253]
MTAFTRATTATFIAVAAVAALTGCSFLSPEIPRDDSGQVLEPTIIGSTELLVDDCFTFVEGSNLSEAEVTPCTTDHSHIVIGKGELKKSAITDAGGLQNAVSSACSDTFSAFKETVADGAARPDQEFIISERSTDDGALMTDYACIATDAASPTV